jgi:hypothetical protein
MSAFIYNLIAFYLNVRQHAPELSWPGPGREFVIEQLEHYIRGAKT